MESLIEYPTYRHTAMCTASRCSRAGRVSIVLGAMLLAGCSALSPYSTQTRLELSLVADEQLNPDIHGRPSPLVLRLLELKHPVAFTTGDFFNLYDRPEHILGQDLIAMEELEVRPGQVRNLKLSVGSQSRYVGVLAAYRDLSGRRFHHVIPLMPQSRAVVRLALGREGIESPADISVPVAGTQP